MKQKVSFSRRGVVNLLVAVIGFGLLVVLALVLNALFSSRLHQQPTRPNEQTGREPQLNSTGVEAPSPSAVSTINQTDPTVDWKTYKNQFFEYRFKYPGTWRLFDPPLPKDDHWNVVSSATVTSYEEKELNFRAPTEGASFSVSVARDKKGQSLEKWLEEHETNLSSVSKRVSFNDLTGMKFRRVPKNKQAKIKESIVALEKDKRIYVIDYSIIGDDPGGKLLDQLELILSTFEVLD